MLSTPMKEIRSCFAMVYWDTDSQEYMAGLSMLSDRKSSWTRFYAHDSLTVNQ